MKKNLITQSAMMLMAFALSFTLTGCGEDAIVEPPVVTPGPDPIVDTTAVTLFSCNSSGTRTTMGADGVFYWEDGDQIWVDEDGNGTFTLRSNDSDLSTDKRRAGFFFRQKLLTNPSYNLTYTGNKSTSGTVVTIASSQTQSAWNNSDHIGSVGDCGIATATPTATGYEFTLRHKASYLVFQPYKAANITDGWKLMSIEIVDADGNSLCGTYPFGIDGLDINNVSSESSTVTLNLANTGFTLPYSASSSCFAVIQPGAHNLWIKYNIQPTGSANGVAGGTFSLTKELDRTFNPNGVTIIRHELGILTYSTDVYYMWDAAVGAYYWSGVSNPPTFFGGSNTNYPKNASDSRWCNTDDTGAAASRSCRDLPNANVMTWYTMAGDPRWDDGYPWCFNNDQANVCSYGA